MTYHRYLMIQTLHFSQFKTKMRFYCKILTYGSFSQREVSSDWRLLTVNWSMWTHIYGLLISRPLNLNCWEAQRGLGILGYGMVTTLDHTFFLSIQFLSKWPYPESNQLTGNLLFTKTTSQRVCNSLMNGRYALLASSQIPDWIQNTVDHLQRTSWQGTYLHPRNDYPIKKQKIFHKIQWRTCLEGSKIQAWYFRQACIHSIWASGMELLAKGN